MRRETLFSSCRRHRFVLWRDWSKDSLCDMQPCAACDRVKQFVQFIGLNPSKANELDNDMTITKCVGFAKRWGYGALCMTNLFTFVSTDPNVLKGLSAEDRLSSELWITEVAQEAALIVAAWGNDGARFTQSRTVMDRLRSMGKTVHCLGTTTLGWPRHPSRIGYDSKLEIMKRGL